jgi:tRNA (guanine-N(7)-)-methyltransferase subunit TRM82
VRDAGYGSSSTSRGIETNLPRELPKKPTEIRFTQDSQTILVSDKFGDVFRFVYGTFVSQRLIQFFLCSYPVHLSVDLLTNLNKKASKDALASHENPWGNLMLGHVSLLTTFLLTPDEQYIITADRDEHIRVSWYPQGYNIERFCLGHQKCVYLPPSGAVMRSYFNKTTYLIKRFVSAIHIPDFAQDTLISGGGDEVIKLWDWMAGTVKHEVSVLDFIRPFVKVKAPRRRRWHDDNDGDDDDAEPGNDGDITPHREQTLKRKRDVQGRAVEDHGIDSGRALSLGASEQTPDDAGEDVVLVMHKIASSQKRIVFSAVG